MKLNLEEKDSPLWRLNQDSQEYAFMMQIKDINFFKDADLVEIVKICDQLNLKLSPDTYSKDFTLCLVLFYQGLVHQLKGNVKLFVQYKQKIIKNLISNNFSDLLELLKKLILAPKCEEECKNMIYQISINLFQTLVINIQKYYNKFNSIALAMMNLNLFNKNGIEWYYNNFFQAYFNLKVLNKIKKNNTLANYYIELMIRMLQYENLNIYTSQNIMKNFYQLQQKVKYNQLEAQIQDQIEKFFKIKNRKKMQFLVENYLTQIHGTNLENIKKYQLEWMRKELEKTGKHQEEKKEKIIDTIYYWFLYFVNNNVKIKDRKIQIWKYFIYLFKFNQFMNDFQKGNFVQNLQILIKNNTYQIYFEDFYKNEFTQLIFQNAQKFDKIQQENLSQEIVSQFINTKVDLKKDRLLQPEIIQLLKETFLENQQDLDSQINPFILLAIYQQFKQDFYMLKQNKYRSYYQIFQILDQCVSISQENQQTFIERINQLYFHYKNLKIQVQNAFTVLVSKIRINFQKCKNLSFSYDNQYLLKNNLFDNFISQDQIKIVNQFIQIESIIIHYSQEKYDEQNNEHEFLQKIKRISRSLFGFQIYFLKSKQKITQSQKNLLLKEKLSIQFPLYIFNKKEKFLKIQRKQNKLFVRNKKMTIINQDFSKIELQLKIMTKRIMQAQAYAKIKQKEQTKMNNQLRKGELN